MNLNLSLLSSPSKMSKKDKALLVSSSKVKSMVGSILINVSVIFVKSLFHGYISIYIYIYIYIYIKEIESVCINYLKRTKFKKFKE